jgi:chorismate mutase/prephenate dehydrogenase
MDQNQSLNIEKYRQEISSIDRDLFALIKRREQLSAQIGEAKRNLNIPDKDFNREKAVFDQAIALAKELDLPASFATSLQKLVMELSLSRQERDRIKHSVATSPLSATLIGGAGRLGGWLCRFFADSGHEIKVIDKIKPEFPCNFSRNIEPSIADSDIIVVATPIRISSNILGELAQMRLTKPVVFDVSSVKAPVKDALINLQSMGTKVTSLHPMFGPSVELLFGKHIIITSVGDKVADDLARDLFKSTSVSLVTMSIDEHDSVIAYLLSLAHLINIIFVATLEKSGMAINFLSQFSSPTFSNLLNSARKVFSENPHLYYEIQALNPHTKNTYKTLSKILKDTITNIENLNEEAFVNLMKKGQSYLTTAPTS